MQTQCSCVHACSSLYQYNHIQFLTKELTYYVHNHCTHVGNEFTKHFYLLNKPVYGNNKNKVHD